MLHEVFKDIFADIFGWAARRPAGHPAAHASHLDAEAERWRSPACDLHEQDDSRSGVFSHYQDGIACDVYGRPI